MPKYELMYILASAVSDDQVPQVTEQVTQYIKDFGGTDINEQQLGKKKLAYPIKKTRNGFYVVVDFDMPTNKINNLDAKIRTQDNTIIRYLITNQEEHLERLEKDKVIQAKMNKGRPEEQTQTQPTTEESPSTEPTTETTDEKLDEQIEAALNEEVK